MLCAEGETGRVSVLLSRNIREEKIRGHETKRPSSNRPCSNPKDSAETNSPQTFWRGKWSFSSNNTFTPERAAVIAHAEPAGPAPITIKSYWAVSKRSLPCGKDKTS